MADQHSDPSLYAECLAAMAVSGDVYPCDTLAPAPEAACALPPDDPTPTPIRSTDRT